MCEINRYSYDLMYEKFQNRFYIGQFIEEMIKSQLHTFLTFSTCWKYERAREKREVKICEEM